MPTRLFVQWIVLATILGFVLGGSSVWLGQPPAEQQAVERASSLGLVEVGV